MDCPACGADNREGARFCRGCGHKLLVDEVQPAVEAGEVPEEVSLSAESEEVEGEEPLAPAEPVEEAADEPEPEPPEAEGEGEPDAAAGEQEEVAEEPVAIEPDPEPDVTDPDPESVPAAEAEPEPAAEAEPESSLLPDQDEDSLDPVETAPTPEEPDLAEPLDSLDEPEKEAGLEPLDGVEDEVLGFWRDEAELMTPVEPKTVVAGRYMITEALDVQEDEILYTAYDLVRCWQCNYDENDPEGTFCARCGVLMDHRPEVRLLEVQDPEIEPSDDRIVKARLTHGLRHLLLLAEPKPEPEPEPELPPAPRNFRLLVSQCSDAGQVRELDEDSLLVMTMAPTYESRTGPVMGLFAVADGMGGHEGGEVASKLALRMVADQVIRSIVLPALSGELVLEDDITILLRQATIAANDAVYLARQKRENDMGTTLTTALIRDNRLFLAHVGDCRAYRWNADGLQQLTTDHSVVASMIAEGQAEPEEIYTHPHRSIIYRCIGDKPVVDVDTDVLPLAVDDRVILCCDGLWEMIRDEGIEDVMMQEADPQAACDLLVRHANAAGGEDNISVIIIQVEGVWAEDA